MAESLGVVGIWLNLSDPHMTPASPAAWLVLVNAASTLFMTGVIWFVQVVHYPLFTFVGEDVFAGFARAHAGRTAWVVGVPMLVELAATIAIAAILGGALAWLGLGLLAIIWCSTGVLQVPAHRQLQQGLDAVIHRRLVATNWVRTAAWSTRAVSTVLLLVPSR